MRHAPSFLISHYASLSILDIFEYPTSALRELSIYVSNIRGKSASKSRWALLRSIE